MSGLPGGHRRRWQLCRPSGGALLSVRVTRHPFGRGSDLGASMSHYLIDRVTSLDNVEVRTPTQVVGFEADGRLQSLLVSSGEDRARSACQWTPFSSASVEAREPRPPRYRPGYGRGRLPADRKRTDYGTGMRSTGGLWRASPTSGDQPARTVCSWRRAQRLYQALRGGHRRGIDGGGPGAPPAGGGRA